MKLKDTLTLLKAGYTRDEIRAFDNENEAAENEPETTAAETSPGIVQALSVLSDKVVELQAAFAKQTAAAEPATDDVASILAKLQKGITVDVEKTEVE